MGKKWAKIGKDACFGRTEHMIKNRYWWLINNYKLNCKGLSNRDICSKILINIGGNEPETIN